MGSLHRRDYERMLDLVAAVTDGMLHEEPWPLITRELNDCLRGNVTAFQAEMSPASHTSRVLAWAPEPAGRSPLDPRLRAHGREHPLAAVFAAGGNPGPLTVNDVVEDRWRRNGWYEATHRRFDGGVRHLGLPLPSPAGTIRALVTCRPGRDFGARDRELARRLQPLLVSVDRHLTELKRIRDLIPPGQASTGAKQAAVLGITPRETTVLGLLAQGLTAAAIARRLGISAHTVSKHQENAYRKLDTNDRLTTVLRARELGIIPPFG